MATGHDKVERNVGLLIILTVLVISVGGLVEIVPLFFQKSTTEAVAGLKPYPALELEGRDIYIRESCMVCHSQMIRPFRARDRALRPLLRGRRVHLRPPVPVGQASAPGRTCTASAAATPTSGTGCT
jgi:hypothetical protein